MKGVGPVAVDLGDDDHLLAGGGIDHLIVPHIDADAVDVLIVAGPEEEQVPGHELADPGDLLPLLLLGVPGGVPPLHVLAHFLQAPVHEPAGVKARLGGLAAPGVGVVEILLGDHDQLLPRRRVRRGRRLRRGLRRIRGFRRVRRRGCIRRRGRRRLGRHRSRGRRDLGRGRDGHLALDDGHDADGLGGVHVVDDIRGRHAAAGQHQGAKKQDTKDSLHGNTSISCTVTERVVKDAAKGLTRC